MNQGDRERKANMTEEKPDESVAMRVEDKQKGCSPKNGLIYVESNEGWKGPLDLALGWGGLVTLIRPVWGEGGVKS